MKHLAHGALCALFALFAVAPIGAAAGLAPTPCAADLHRGFNPSHYRVQGMAGEWTLAFHGEALVASPTTPAGGVVLLRDSKGATTLLEIPRGGSLVRAPGLILVSRIPVRLGEHAATPAPAAPLGLSQPTTYSSGYWQTFRANGCAKAMEWDHGSQCWRIQCDLAQGGHCGIAVQTTSGIHVHSSKCSDGLTIRICGGILEVPF